MVLNKITLSELEKIAAERDSLLCKIKEYEKLLEEKPDSAIQYINNVTVPFYQFSLDLKKINYINKAAELFCGSSSEEIYQNADLWFSSIYQEDKSNVIESLFQMVKNKKKEILLEYRIKKPDDTIVYIADRATLINDAQGHPNCIMGFLTDMTGFMNARKEMLIYDQILSVSQTEKSIDVAVEAILKISCLSFEWDEAEVWLVEQSSGLLYCIKIWSRLHNEPKEFYEASYQLKIPVNEGFQGEVLRTKLPTLANDYRKNKGFIRGELITKAGFKTAFGIPISYQGNALGVLIFFSKKIKNLTHEQIHMLQRISEILGERIQSKISKEEMSYMIYHDNLTGLINRFGLEAFLQNQISKNKNESVSLIIINLDQFHNLNESMGFSFGDSLIGNIASKLNEHLFDTISAIANIGGGQLAFVLCNIKRPEEIGPLLERIKAIVKAPLNIQDKRILLTLSIGVAIYPYDAIEHLSLLKNTTIALNHAKSRGGDCVQYFSETLQKTVTEAINLESDLRKALSENDFRIHYQPKVDIESGGIIGLEALLRWQSPDRGLLLPDSFLNVAEQSDLIVYIGKWVLLQICRDFPFTDLNMPVSVNFSARQFQKQFEIEHFIKIMLEKFSLRPSFLEIEVTESQMMSDPIRSMDVLSSLQKIGTTISIDDFGVGYSSFEYLKRFRPNRIKIDKSFIDGLPFDRENAGIVRAIIALCKSLNIRVIAEGVENAEQLRFLINEQCDEIQGFYFSKPLPLYDVRDLIDRKVKLVLPDGIKRR
ncbi:EAL domain-containing protein [Fluoribacter gormanii]|uniref:GGDEF domain-containing phosphodiesterase n=1 Tax=Fluoribacter gormanii TaxID=464 RepID=UPI0022446EF5|nr:GGDEF domain-containing phosphodiesterase [Fluoribacter gormanii]MCW8471745.1 EAL domain-containing protein [Fluoribacter gormanii]